MAEPLPAAGVIPAHNPRHDVRMDGVDFFRASARGPFRKALDEGNYSYCFMVRTGRVRLEIEFPTSSVISLRPGDVVAVSGLAPHVFSSEGPVPVGPATPFAMRPMTSAPGSGEVELIIGVAPSEAMALTSLTLGPILIRPSVHPDLSRRVWRVAEMLEDEYADGPQIDRSLVVRRLAEIILINMSRRFLTGRLAAEPQGPQAPASRQVMLAINAYFSAPHRAWTVAELARAAGMSRTRFAEAFRSVTGQTPARIVARLRLTAAARRLASEDLGVDAAAEEAGYGSAAAFVRAFQRAFGETPARWRRRQQARAPRDASSHRRPRPALESAS